MKIHDLAIYLEKLEKISSRIEITEILADLFKKSDEEEIANICNLLLGQLAPAYKSIVFNVADKMMIEVLAKAYDKDVSKVKELNKQKGDLGNVAEELSLNNTTSNATVNDVFDALVDVAKEEGEGSVEKKIEKLSEILKELDLLSARYVTRIPVGKLRLGFSDKTMIDALSWMEVGDKSKSNKLKKAYEVLPDIGLLAERVKMRGIEVVTKDVIPEVGIPIMPMLAQRLNTTKEMIDKMGEVAIEPKFDGVRILIHYQKSKDGETPYIRAFTRNMNEISHMFPELKHIGKYIRANAIILDSEGVGIDPKTERIVDFQKTMQRRRKKEIGKASLDIPFRFQIFDVMYKDGKSLMHKTYDDRRSILDSLFKENKLFTVDSFLITKDPDVIKKEHKRLLDMGLEGIIAKKRDAEYVPGRTGWRWVKMKEEEGNVGKLADTLDCVVMGYTRGKGKRASFGIGQFLAGIRKNGKFFTVTKVGTGLTDDQFKELKKRLARIHASQKPKEYEVTKDLEPDFWVEPKLVVELAADEITVSPRHSSKYALRFPRLVRFRDDKNASQGTTFKEMDELFKMQ